MNMKSISCMLRYGHINLSRNKVGVGSGGGVGMQSGWKQAKMTDSKGTLPCVSEIFLGSE